MSRDRRRSARPQAPGHPAESLEPRHLLSNVVWTGAAGDNQWTTPGNWSTNALPTTGDDVTLNLPGTGTIDITGGMQSIRNLKSSDPLRMWSGVLAVATSAQLTADLTLAGGAVQGGIWSFAGGSELLGSSGTLDAVTINGNLNLNADGDRVSVLNGLTLNGTATLGGSPSSLSFEGGDQTLGGIASVIFGDARDTALLVNSAGATLTIDPAVSIRGGSAQQGGAYIGDDPDYGSSANVSIVNLGTVTADTSGQTIHVAATSFISEGTLGADSGSLSVQSTSTSIHGNLIASSGGQIAVPTGTTLDGATISGDVTFGGEAINAINGLTLANGAVVKLSGSDRSRGVLNFIGTQTLGGSGQLLLTDDANTRLLVSAAAQGQPPTLTIGTGVTVHGQGIISGDADSTLANAGNLIADVADKVLQVSTANFNSQGTATSVNGGILSISSSSSVTISSGNVVVPSGVAPTSMVVTGGDVTFAGAAPVALRSLTLSGGSLDGTAPLTLAGPASWTGGTIAMAGGLTVLANVTLTVSGAASHIATTPINNAGVVNLTDGTLEMNGGGTESGSFTLGPTSTLSLGGNAPGSFVTTSAVSGPGMFAVQDSAVVVFTGAYDVGATLVAGGGILELIPGARVASIGTLSVNGGTFSCGDAGLDAAPGFLRSSIAPLPGTVNVLTALALGGGDTLVQPGWTLSVGSGGLTFTGATSPEVHLVSDPITSGRLLLGGDVTFAGSGGTAAILSVGTAAVPGQIDLGGAQRSFVINDGSAATDLAIAANIANGSMRDSGSGRVQLGSAAAFAGGITIAGGITEIDDAGALGSGAINFAGGTLAFGPSITTMSNAFTAAPADSISLDAGTSSPEIQSLTPGSALNVTGSVGGSLVVAGPVALQHDLTLNNSVPVTIAGAIGGAFALTKTGTASLTFSGASANTYSGATAVDGGSLVLKKAAGLAVPGDLTINGPATVMLSASDQIAPGAALVLNSASGPALLDLAGHNQALGSIVSLLPASGITLGSGTLTVGGGGASTAFSGAVSGSGTLIKQGAGTLTLGPGASLQGVAIQIADGGIACSTGPSRAIHTIRSLAISGGARMDLGDDTLMIAYTGGPSPADTIRSYMTSAFAGGVWSGPGLGTSSAGVTLGFADSADGVVAGLPANTFLVKPALAGDANLDRSVNFADLLNLAQHYGQTNATWDRGDTNYDGTVGFADLLVLAQHYGQTSAASGTDAAPWLGTASPQPLASTQPPRRGSKISVAARHSLRSAQM